MKIHAITPTGTDLGICEIVSNRDQNRYWLKTANGSMVIWQKEWCKQINTEIKMEEKQELPERKEAVKQNVEPDSVKAEPREMAVSVGLEPSKSKELSFQDVMANLSAKSKESLVVDTGVNQELIDHYKQTYKDIILTDKSGYDYVVNGLKMVKKSRTFLQSTAKSYRDPMTKFSKELKAYEDAFVDQLTPIEKYLTDVKIEFEDKLKAEEQAKLNARVTQLTESGYGNIGGVFVSGIVQLSVEQIVTMEDDSFNYYVEAGKKELERIKAEEQRKQEEKAELQLEREKLASEREELRILKEELLKMKAEISIQAEVLDQKYEEPVVAVSEFEQVEFLEPNPITEIIPELEISSENITDSKPPFFQPRELGFNEFRDRFIALMESDQKFTRPELIEWAKCQTLI